MPRIITITGPTGAGKTDTGWAVLEKLAQNGISAVLMDADWYANSRPFSWDNSKDLESVFDQVKMLAQHHFSDGREVLVIPNCPQFALNIQPFESWCDENKIKLDQFCLVCSIEELEKRVSGRDRIPEQKAHELIATKRQSEMLQNGLIGNKSCVMINNSTINEQTTAVRILNTLQLA